MLAELFPSCIYPLFYNESIMGRARVLDVVTWYGKFILKKDYEEEQQEGNSGSIMEKCK